MKVIVKSVITQFYHNNKGITTFTIKTGNLSADQVSMIGKEVSNYCEVVLEVS